VPADLSQAVSDTAGPDFAFFGNDAGNFITMAVDVDFVLDAPGLGTRSFSVLQGISRGGRGGGVPRGSRFTDRWTVSKKPAP
jgi:hypothetical protein